MCCVTHAIQRSSSNSILSSIVAMTHVLAGAYEPHNRQWQQKLAGNGGNS